MPLVFRNIVHESSIIGVWKIEESMQELTEMLNPDSEQLYMLNSFSNEKRKKQWLGYRIVLRNIIASENWRINYDQYGKPFIEDYPYYISASHSGDYAVAIINKSRVGIDIEKIRDRIERVKNRFLTEKELDFIGEKNRLEKLHVCWGVKESLYKLNGTPDVEFRSNIVLDQFDYLCNDHLPFKCRS